MTHDEAPAQDRIPKLVEESSIGSPGAQELRRRTPRDLAAAAVHAADEPKHESSDVPDEWITAAIAGDQTAVERLLRAIWPMVVRYCYARLGNDDLPSVSADDVAQEVCLAVLTSLPAYRVQKRPFLAFVYGIAAHKVIDAHRAALRNRFKPVSSVPTDASSIKADVPDARASAALAAALAALPAKHREILLLRVVVGLSPEDTATAVGSTPGAVRVAQHRALSRLHRSWPGALDALNSKASGMQTRT